MILTSKKEGIMRFWIVRSGREAGSRRVFVIVGSTDGARIFWANAQSLEGAEREARIHYGITS